MIQLLPLLLLLIVVGNGKNVVMGLAGIQQQPSLPVLRLGVVGTGTSTTESSSSSSLAQKAMSYFDSSTDPFHAVQSSIDLLRTAGFVELTLSSSNNNENIDIGTTATVTSQIQPGGKYYYTRNRSTLVAFAVGHHCCTSSSSSSSDFGIKIIGGHSDSPNLRIKPRSQQASASSSSSCIQIGVECYGGGLWHTWFDRDLGISGRVMIRQPQQRQSSTINSTSTTTSDDIDDGNDFPIDIVDDTDNSNNNDFTTTTMKITQQLIQINRPILRISNLAIHLQNDDERKAFKYNKEEHLVPILAMEVQKALTGGSTDDNGGDGGVTTKITTKDGWTEYQEPVLLQLLADELNVNISDIVDFELNLFDVQKAALGGAHSEFIHSARLDNLASCFLAVQSLIDHVDDTISNNFATDTDVSMIVLYDHEEVGSNSAVGAASPILDEAVRRISAALSMATTPASISTAHANCIQRSFVLSSDQAHAVHPNYSSRHEKYHQPKMNQGMVIKRNSNQRYATTPITGLMIREVARRANLSPIQEFMVRQDCGCGSTIGPVISAATGIRTIDMGCPQLSMHSIRETMGVHDLTNGLNLFKAYFKHFREVDSSIEQ